MQEQLLRHQYLDAMGIDSWVARKLLPNAAPSPDWVADFCSANAEQYSGAEGEVSSTHSASSNAQRAAVVSTGVEAGKSGIKSLSASLTQSNNDTDKATAARQAQEQAHDTVSHLPVSDQGTEVEHATQPSELRADVQNDQVATAKTNPHAAENVPRHAPLGHRTEKTAPVMRLMFWQFKDVLVVDSVPTHTRGTMASEQYQQLLTNMINAMSLDSQLLQPNGQPFVLNWPTLAGVSIDQGWDQAVSAVQHKLTKILHSYQPKLALLLGEHSAQMVMNVDEPFDDVRGMVFSLRSDIKAVAGYSLTQLLNVPGCKRELWVDLQKVLNS